MIGSPELDVDGITAAGEHVPVLRQRRLADLSRQTRGADGAARLIARIPDVGSSGFAGGSLPPEAAIAPSQP